MTPCKGGSDSPTWCCGNSTECCDTPSEIQISKFLGGSVSSMSSTSPSNSPTSTTLPSDSSSKGLSDGAKAGIGVGCAAGALAILILVFLFLQRQKNRQKSKIPVTDSTPSKYVHEEMQEPRELGLNRVYETSGGLENSRYELRG